MGDPVTVDGAKKKNTVANRMNRTWLKFDTNGSMQVHIAKKQHIIRDTGVNARDLRILEAGQHAPASILSRERALVVNVENIKLILTFENAYVLVRNDDVSTYAEPLKSFVSSLKERSALTNAALGIPLAPSYGGDLGKADHLETGYSSDDSSVNVMRFNNQRGGDYGYHSDGDVAHGETRGFHLDRPQVNYYEFRVLEITLDVVSTFLERKADQLDNTARAAVKALTAKVTAHNLERVRKTKGDMTQLISRVTQVKNELEHLLNDDSDMNEMYLTRKLVAESPRREPSNRLHRARSVIDTPGQHPEPLKYDVDDLEDLLETFNEPINGIYNKLHALSEHIDDTEDFINLLQDSHRNKLIQLDLVMTSLTFSVSVLAAVSSVFGMNLHSGLEDNGVAFSYVIVVGLIVSSLVFLAFLMYSRKQSLL